MTIIFKKNAPNVNSVKFTVKLKALSFFKFWISFFKCFGTVDLLAIINLLILKVKMCHKV